MNHTLDYGLGSHWSPVSDFTGKLAGNTTERHSIMLPKLRTLDKISITKPKQNNKADLKSKRLYSLKSKPIAIAIPSHRNHIASYLVS